MKKLSLFFCALAVSAMAMAAEATYAKVKSAPADWSGEYVIVYEAKADTAYVFTGVDASKDFTPAVIASGAVTGEFITVKIAKMEGGYSLMVNGGDKDGLYMAGKSSGNGLYFNKDAALNTIEMTETGVKITSGRVLQFNDRSSDLRFRYYTDGNQKAVQLYKLKKQTQPTMVESIELKNDGVDTIEVGDKLTLSYTITPDSATDQRVEFSIESGSEYISLNNGVVTGLAVGDAQVKVVALDSLNKSAKLSATYNIHIKEATYTTCAEANAAAKDTQMKLNKVTVVYVNGSNIYVKDDSGSTMVFQSASGLKAGDIVAGIQGKAAPFSGLPELKPTNAVKDWVITAGEAPAIPEAEAAPTAAEVNQVLVWKGVTGLDGEFKTASATNLTGKFQGEDINLRNNFKIAQTFDKTHSYDITGAVAIYVKDQTTTIQVYFISAKDNGEVTALIDNKAEKSQAKKMMVNGQMVIVRDGKMYNALGAEL